MLYCLKVSHYAGLAPKHLRMIIDFMFASVSFDSWVLAYDAHSQMLLPRFKMQGDVEYDPEEDWLDDNKGLDIMGYPDFFDALFELADMWLVRNCLGPQSLRENSKSKLISRKKCLGSFCQGKLMTNSCKAVPSISVHTCTLCVLMERPNVIVFI
jgi:hypothetical protein